MKIIFHNEAKLEMQAAAIYYENQEAGLGKHFLEEIRSATNQIQHFPNIFQIVTKNVRRCCLKRFPFGLIFRQEKDFIQIIAVIHFKRKPGYWRNRI